MLYISILESFVKQFYENCSKMYYQSMELIYATTGREIKLDGLLIIKRKVGFSNAKVIDKTNYYK
jgi:hypothetical protein